MPRVLQKLSHQPEEQQAASKNILKELIAAADVKKGMNRSSNAHLVGKDITNDYLPTVPPKAKGRKRDREADKPLSGLDVDELLQGQKRLRISPDNAIPEFKQTLSNTDDVGVIKDAVKQLSTIIEDQIRNSLGDINYDRAIEGIGTMRDELIAFEEPDLYNEFIRRLKQKLLSDELNGDRREVWWLVRRHKLGLIDKEASEVSGVTVQESREVWQFLVSPKRIDLTNHVYSSCRRSQQNDGVLLALPQDVLS